MKSTDRTKHISSLEQQVVDRIEEPWEVETIEYRHDVDTPDVLQARLILRCEKPTKNTIL